MAIILQCEHCRKILYEGSSEDFDDEKIDYDCCDKGATFNLVFILLFIAVIIYLHMKG